MPPRGCWLHHGSPQSWLSPSPPAGRRAGSWEGRASPRPPGWEVEPQTGWLTPANRWLASHRMLCSTSMPIKHDTTTDSKGIIALHICRMNWTHNTTVLFPHLKNLCCINWYWYVYMLNTCEGALLWASSLNYRNTHKHTHMGGPSSYLVC